VDDKIWFNEHEGNAMAYFDIRNPTLVEYQVPTKGRLWGNTSNPLKFTIDSKGSIWFTEWTENKIGVLESKKVTNLPLWLTVSKEPITLDASSGEGDKLMIYVYPNSSYFREQYSDKQQIPNNPVKITTATSITPSGKLWNIISTPSKETFYFDYDSMTDNNSSSNPYLVEMEIKPVKGIKPGNYTLTVGTRYESVTYSKIIDLIVRNR
jgi:virginiamycin B lyase